MAVLNPFMLKIQTADADLSLTAKTGRSLLVKDIWIYNPAASPGYGTLKIDRDTVGFFRVGGNLGNHLPLPKGSVNHSHALTVAAADGSLTEDHALSDAHGVANAHAAIYSDRSAETEEADIVGYGAIPKGGYETLLAYLMRRGLFRGYPVGEGQTFLITGVHQAGSIQMVLYEECDAGDHPRTAPNGSEASEYEFVNYGRVAAAVTTTGSTIFNTVQSPAEFPDFPFGNIVPARTEIDILGILASDVVDDRGSNDSMNTDFIKLIRGRETLFDEDKNGILLKGLTGTTDAAAEFARGVSLVGNFSAVDQKPPLLLDPPLVFVPGEELGVYVTTTAGPSQSASDLAAADLEIGLIERVRRVA